MSAAGIVILVLSIIFWIISGILSTDLYSKKGYYGGFWVGFLLGIIGLIYSAGLPDLVGRRIAQSSNEAATLAPAYSTPAAAETTTPERAEASAPQQVQAPIPEPVLLRDMKGNIMGFKIDDTTFSVGDAVKHPTLGEGVITEISEKEFAVKLKKGLVVHPDIKGNKYEKI